MTTVKINLDDNNQYSSPGASWNTIYPTDITPVALTDINGDPTGWTIRWSDGFAPSNGGGGYNGVGVGDASWADDPEVLQHAIYHNSFSSNDYSELIVEGPDELTIGAVGSYQDSTSHQDTEIWVNSETPQVILTYDTANSRGNSSDAASFPGVLKDGNNQFVIRFRDNSGARGYLNGLQLVAPAAADTTAPTISSASVPTAGDTISVQMSEAVQVGAGGSGGWTISLGDATISSAAVDGTDNTIINLTPSRTLLSGESFTIGYTQPGDGFQDQAATSNDLATLSGAAVTNNSSQVAQVPGISAITVQKDGVAVQATDWEINIALNSDDSEVYSGTSITSNASGAIAAINTTGGSVGDAVTVEGFSAANNYGFKFTQNLEDNA